jgi:hypothetical protein
VLGDKRSVFLGLSGNYGCRSFRDKSRIDLKEKLEKLVMVIDAQKEEFQDIVTISQY